MTRDRRQFRGLHPADQEFLAQVETHGWNVNKVFRGKGETGPEWAFSAGLYHSYQHPEIVIFGLDLSIMHKIVNNIGDEVKKGTTFEPGKQYQRSSRAADAVSAQWNRITTSSISAGPFGFTGTTGFRHCSASGPTKKANIRGN
jgi:hypothetical protein